MLILFQGNTYLYQRMPDKVTEYFLFLNTPELYPAYSSAASWLARVLPFRIYITCSGYSKKSHKSRPELFIISRTVYHYFSCVGRQENVDFRKASYSTTGHRTYPKEK